MVERWFDTSCKPVIRDNAYVRCVYAMFPFEALKDRLQAFSQLPLWLPVGNLDEDGGFVPDWKQKINTHVCGLSFTHTHSHYGHSIPLCRCHDLEWELPWQILQRLTAAIHSQLVGRLSERPLWLLAATLIGEKLVVWCFIDYVQFQFKDMLLPFCHISFRWRAK